MEEGEAMTLEQRAREACPICDGTGELDDAQAWDCGQENSPCPYCAKILQALKDVREADAQYLEYAASLAQSEGVANALRGNAAAIRRQEG
jgi:hypothetical protein